MDKVQEERSRARPSGAPSASSPVAALAARLIPGLKRGAGDNMVGYCPLHGEVPGRSKPSFSFNTRTGQWCCFSGCGGGGLQRLLRELGYSRERTDVTVSKLSAFLQKVEAKRQTFGTGGLFSAKYPLPERILGLFDFCPQALLDDGFEKDVLQAHDVGFDFDRNRITFPVRDTEGQLAGIVGRNLGEGPKYKVYEEEVRQLGFRPYDFSNHDLLWRGDQVYPRASQEEDPTMIVVEGFKACLWLVQFGYENAVALMGSRMSRHQRWLLERIGGTAILFLDGDDAGREGTRRIGYQIRGCKIRVATYPDGARQPDDLDPTELERVINQTVSFPNWRRRWQGPK